MISNIERFTSELDKLVIEGKRLLASLEYQINEKRTMLVYSKLFKSKEDLRDFFHELPHFNTQYQSWYSEALYLIKQIIPLRLNDFVRLYEKPKDRKSIDYENYRIEDALHNLQVTKAKEVKVDASAAISLVEQQIAIVVSAKRRFSSSLFEIHQSIQANLFDAEIEAAENLVKRNFIRAGGTLIGVVLQRHLKQVMTNHDIKDIKKNMTISICSDILKMNHVIDQNQWRLIQFLKDIVNACDHTHAEPLQSHVLDLIDGVKKVIKIIY